MANRPTSTRAPPRTKNQNQWSRNARRSSSRCEGKPGWVVIKAPSRWTTNHAATLGSDRWLRSLVVLVSGHLTPGYPLTCQTRTLATLGFVNCCGCIIDGKNVIEKRIGMRISLDELAGSGMLSKECNHDWNLGSWLKKGAWDSTVASISTWYLLVIYESFEIWRKKTEYNQ